MRENKATFVLVCTLALCFFYLLPSASAIEGFTCASQPFLGVDEHQITLTCTWEVSTNSLGDSCPEAPYNLNVTFDNHCILSGTHELSSGTSSLVTLTPRSLASEVGSVQCNYVAAIGTSNDGNGCVPHSRSFSGSGTIYNKNRVIPVDVDAEEGDEHDDADSIKVIGSRYVRLYADTSEESYCRYRILYSGNPADVYSGPTLNYNNALDGCDTSTHECGTLGYSNGYHHYTYINLRDRTKFPDSQYERDMNDDTSIIYGVYCTVSGIPVEAYTYGSTEFYIDTIPPHVTNAEGNFGPTIQPRVVFEDHDAMNTKNSHGSMEINSRTISMFFRTNEDAICRFQESRNWDSINDYATMSRDASTEFSKSHKVYFTPTIGIPRTFHIACKDRVGNEDENESDVQTTFVTLNNRTTIPFLNQSHTILFMFEDPEPVDEVIAYDDSEKRGGSIIVNWTRSNQDGTNQNYVTRYDIFRVKNSSTTNGSLNRSQLVSFFENENPNVVRVARIPAQRNPDIDQYTFTDSSESLENFKTYYYYVMARYFNDTYPEIMVNIGYNSSSIQVSNPVQAIDDLGPRNVRNLNISTARGRIEGDRIKLEWNLSLDDPNSPDEDDNLKNVVNYTIYRADGTVNIIEQNYTNISILSPGKFSFVDVNVNYLQEYCYIVKTTNSDNLSRNSTPVCGTPNSQPYFQSIQILPPDPRTTDHLTCLAFIVDRDGDDLRDQVVIEWEILHDSTKEKTTFTVDPAACTPPFKGSFQNQYFEHSTTECVAHLDSSHFNKADKVWCRVHGTDGLEAIINPSTGQKFAEDIAYINNTPPFATDVHVIPSDPEAIDNLFCNYTFNDIDGDLEDTDLAVFEWYVNNDGMNEFVRLLGQTSQLLHHSLIDQNDLVKCAVKVHDKDTSWLNNPLQAEEYAVSESVFVRDNSIPQIIDYSASPFTVPDSPVTVVGDQVIFNVKWIDIDGDMAQMHVCDSFGSYENQAGSGLDSYVYFGDDDQNQPIKTTFYTNHTGKYVRKISIKPYQFVRNDYYVYGPGSMVHEDDTDIGKILFNFSGPLDRLKFHDADMSGIYRYGEAIVYDVNNNGIYEHGVDKIISGRSVPNRASLTKLSISHKFLPLIDDTGYYPGTNPVLDLAGTWMGDINNWTNVEDMKFGSNNVAYLAYGNGLLVAVGDGGTASYSYDGINWNGLDVKFSDDDVYSVAYGGGNWVAVGDEGKGSFSTNGINWQSVDINMSSKDGNSVAYGNGLWIVVGSDGEAAYSSNGKSWNTLDIEFELESAQSIAYGDGVWVTVGEGGQASYSTDGIDWTNINIGFDLDDAYSVAYGNGMWVVVGENNKGSYSYNGVDWNSISDMGFNNDYIASVAYGDGTWIAVGQSGKASYSHNGIEWSNIDIEINPTHALAVAYGDGIWIATGESGEASYNKAADDFIIYYDVNKNNQVSINDTRSDGYAEDWYLSDMNRHTFHTHPIYDMYVYEVDYPGQEVDPSKHKRIARDNNNWFVLGQYNHFNPEFNAQPLPNKHLAFVLCIDVNDDGRCDSNSNFKKDAVYVRASTTEPTDYFVYKVNQTNPNEGMYNPDIIINYESTHGGGCVSRSFCSTELSYDTEIYCLYTASDFDSSNQEYAVRVCDEYGACSIARTGTFKVNKIPEMTGVYIGSNSKTGVIGTQNNLMCMHTGAEDIVPQGDFVLVADGNKTIFGDVRNHKNTGLKNGSTIVPFNQSEKGLVVINGDIYNLTFVKTYYEDGNKHKRETYQPNRDALIIDVSGDGIYDSSQDIIIYNPFNSLKFYPDREYKLETVNISHRLSFFDSNNDGNYTFFNNDNNDFNPEDIIYNVPGSDMTTFNAEITYEFLWYVKPLDETEWFPATNFSWLDNDYNDILTHGNTMTGDRWFCQVTATDQYGYSSSMNSSAVTIGSGGIDVDPTLAPTIHNVWDDSNQTNPTGVGNPMTVWIEFSDPDSTQVKAYMCNSSNIIRNSGCWEKEFTRKVYDAAPAGVKHVMTLEYIMEDYTDKNDGVSYSIMLCDPEYHCSEIWTTDTTFYAAFAPTFPHISPKLHPEGNHFAPLDFKSSKNLICNITSFFKEGFGEITQQNSTHWGNSTKNWSMQPLYTWYRERDGSIEKLFENTKNNTLASGATVDGDWITCSAIAFDNQSLSTGWKNSTRIRVGSYVTDTTAPKIFNVTTNSNITHPVNLGDVLNFTIEWRDDDSPNVTIFICNTPRKVVSGCLDKEIARYESATNNKITLSYTTKLEDLKQFSTKNIHALEYYVFASDNSGNIGTYTGGNEIYDVFAVNHIPYLQGIPEVKRPSGTYLSCDYNLVDYGNQTLIPSQYSSDKSKITWYRKISSSEWEMKTFIATQNRVPSFMVDDEDTWICQVTPYDGYAYGIAKNSTPHLVGSTGPRITNYEILSINSPEFEITNNETPLSLGNDIIVRVWWQDDDEDLTTLLAINESDLASADVFAQNTSSENPIQVRFSSDLLNINNTDLDWNKTNPFYFVLMDDSGNITSNENFIIFINRKPQIVGDVELTHNQTENYIKCEATSTDPDEYEPYNSSNTITYAWWVHTGNEWTYRPDYNVKIIPLAVANDGERWKCEATPCDRFSCGESKNSSVYYVGINETPVFTQKTVFNKFDMQENSETTPVIYPESIIFEVEWNHISRYETPQNISMYVCAKNKSTKLGCLGETICSVKSSTGISSCIFNTGSVNMTNFSENTPVEKNYTIFLYDEDGNNASKNVTVHLALKPEINGTVNLSVDVNENYMKCSAESFYTYNGINETLTDNITYAWWVDSGSGWGLSSYINQNISLDKVATNQIWKCQATPHDKYSIGISKNSTTTFSTMEPKPTIFSVDIFNYPENTPNNNISPVKHGDSVIFNVAWQHLNLHMGGETIELYVCENKSGGAGCINGKTWCSSTSSDGSASCILDTSKVNMTKYNNNGTFPYNVYLYDSEGKSVNKSGIVAISIPPSIKNITISPSNPTESESFECIYNEVDLKHNNNESSIYNQTDVYYNWYLDRGNTGNFVKTIYTSKTITPDITQVLDKWICQVTPTNTYINGTPVNSSATTVGNEIEYHDRPNITNVNINSDSENRLLPGQRAEWIISWVDAQQPHEEVQVFICRTNNIIENTGCVEGGFANYHFTKANPIVVSYFVKEADIKNTTKGNISSYIMICDSTGLCSEVESKTFYINDEPKVSNISIKLNTTNQNLICDFDENPGIVSKSDAEYSINWYKYTPEISYCGDGFVDLSAGEQCDGNNLGLVTTCQDLNPDFTGGTLLCNPATCQYDTTLCRGTGEYCGDGELNNLPHEQCDFNIATGQIDSIYNSCSEIDGFSAGQISCNLDTCLLDTSKCYGVGEAACGNGIVEPGEQCELVGDRIIGDKTSCADFDEYIGGQLQCTGCQYDTSLCISRDQIYENLNVNDKILPRHAFSDGDILVCEVTPFDGYHYGRPKMSDLHYGGVNETPRLNDVTAYTFWAEYGSIINSPENPILYGDEVVVIIEWDDFDKYTPDDEFVVIYICNESGANSAGCYEEQLCRIPEQGYTNETTVGCYFNTSKIELNNSGNMKNLTYYVYIFDKDGKTSNGTYNISIHEKPVINVEINNTRRPQPSQEFNTADNLNCTFNITYPNNIDTYDKTTPKFSWYFKRDGSNWQSFQDSQGQVLVNAFTQTNDEWKCEVNYNDGFVDAVPTQSSPVIIMPHNYTGTVPNVTTLTIESGNEYFGESITSGNNATILRYDNTTNVGAQLTFTIDWLDKDQLNHNNESVRVYICNSSRFIENSGCFDRTIAFKSLTNSNPIIIPYTAQNIDNSIQEFWLYLCDKGFNCSDAVNASFMVNHPPGDYKPDIITYTGLDGTTYFECDYETEYELGKGSGDSNGSGRVLKGYDDIASAEIQWYVDSGDGFIPHLSNKTIPFSEGSLDGTERFFCSVEITDVYGLSSGVLNSSILDLSIVPVLWPISDYVYDGTYLVNSSMLNYNGTNNDNITLIGYLPKRAGVSNILAIAYYKFQTPERNADINFEKSTIKGSGTIAISTSEGEDYILINRIPAIGGVFNTDHFIELPGHELGHWKRYNITGPAEEVQENIYKVYISPGLNLSTNVGDEVIVHSGQYPDGWFNFSVKLRPELNRVHIRTNSTGVLGTSNIARVFYDNETPQISIAAIKSGSYTPILNFNVTDDFFVNASTIMVNVSNGTNEIYHFTSDTSIKFSGERGDDIDCNMIDINNYTCSVRLDLTKIKSDSDNYNITVSARDFLNNLGNITKEHSYDSTPETVLPDPVSFAKPIQNSTTLTFGLLVNKTNFTQIEFAVGTAPYPDEGWNTLGQMNYSAVLHGGENSNVNLDFSALTKFLDFNYNVYYDDHPDRIEAKVLNSQDLYLSMDDEITGGLGVKQFSSNYWYACYGNNELNQDYCYIVDSNNNLYNSDTDKILYEPQNIIKISTCEQLQNISNNLSGNYVLIDDVDCDVAPFNSGAGFEPIGTEAEPFTGKLNGNGFIIDSLYISRFSNNIGLFGVLDGYVSNVGLTNTFIEADDNVGAIAGKQLNGSIVKSYSMGTLTGINNVGGLVGLQVNGAIIDSYSNANVEAIANIAGGLVGNQSNGLINRTYSNGTVTGGSSGGLVGVRTSGIVTSSFWDNQTSGQASSEGGIGKTTSEMQMQSTFTDAEWDFDNIWDIDEGQSYPSLKTQQNNEPLSNLINLANTDYRYFDANNNSKYNMGEPVFKSSSRELSEPIELIIPSLIPVLTLDLRTNNLPLIDGNSYRISVRYFDGDDKSEWTSTNPVIYRRGFVDDVEFLKPTDIYVNDRNETHVENTSAGIIIDIAYDNNLMWSWTSSKAQNQDEGEYILHYEYAIGNAPYPYDGWSSVTGWTKVNNQTIELSLDETNLRPKIIHNNMYYLNVRARTSFGIAGNIASSNGIVYDDRTPPEIEVYSVQGIKQEPYNINVELKQGENIIAIIESVNEKVQECRFSIYNVPFTRSSGLSLPCNILPNNETFARCELTNMDGSQINHGQHTYYIACLDKNGNVNRVNSNPPTISFTFDYVYNRKPQVNETWLTVRDSSNVIEFNRDYAYRNEYLFCNYDYWDADGDEKIDTQFRWYKNDALLPIYENKQTLNLSRQSFDLGDTFGCEVRVKDATLRWSTWEKSDTVYINNSPPTAPILLSPDHETYLKDVLNLAWQRSEDIDGDYLRYYFILMNKTEYETEYTVLNRTKVGEDLQNSFNLNLDQRITYNGKNISDGRYYWILQACDDSNYSNNCTNSTQIFSFTRDTTSPVINIIFPKNNSDVGLEFRIQVDVFIVNDEHINVFEVWANISNKTNSYLINLTLDPSNGYYYGNAASNLGDGNYNLTVHAIDSIGNQRNKTYNITVKADLPSLIIDSLPWRFREQYLKNNFRLNLTAQNVAILNYTIRNESGYLFQSNHSEHSSLGNRSFIDLVNIEDDKWIDGRYYIKFYGKADLSLYEETWFNVDKTPPRNGTAIYPNPVNYSTEVNVSIEWFNNSLVPDDNLYGVKTAWIYYASSNDYEAPPQNNSDSSSHNPYIQEEISEIDGSVYKHTLSSTSTRNNFLHWFSCARDYAGNYKCSQIFTINVTINFPEIIAALDDIDMFEHETENKNASKAFWDSDNQLSSYFGIILPTGTLLYDPLNSADYTTAIQGINPELNTMFTNVRDSNATLIQPKHENLLKNPGLEQSENDLPKYWVLKSAGQYNNNSEFNYTIYDGDSAGVNVSAKSYFYQNVEKEIDDSLEYTLSMWMRLSNNAGGNKGRLHVNWYDADWEYLNTTINVSDDSATPPLSNQWKRYNLTVKPPQGAKRARVYLDSDHNNTWVLIDNVVFEQSSKPTFFSKNNYPSAYIQYPVQPTFSNRPYINASEGTLQISIMPLWDASNSVERYLFDSSDLFNIKTATDGNQTYLQFNYNQTKLNLSITDWNKNDIYRLAFTWNSTNLTAYVNGTLNTSINHSTILTNEHLGSSIYLGTNRNKENHIEAVLDEFVIFDYAKNGTEIANDYNTTPVTNNTNIDPNNFTLIYLNITDVNVTTGLFTLDTINSDNINGFVNQRAQFFGVNSAGYLTGTNVINVRIIKEINTIGPNVTLYNNTFGDLPDGGHNLTIYDGEAIPANNITASTINHSILYNTTGGMFSITRGSVLTYAIIYDSHIISSDIFHSNVTNSTIDSSKVKQKSTINDSFVYAGSDIINSSIYSNSTINKSNIYNSTIKSNSIIINSTIDNKSLVINSNITNSNFINVTIRDSNIINSTLNHVNITKATINPTTGDNVKGNNFTLRHSEVVNLTIYNSTVYNATINDSIIIGCEIGTFKHYDPHTDSTMKTNLTIINANLNGTNNNDCKLIEGTVIIIKDGIKYSFTASSGFQPYIKEIWSSKPQVTILSPNSGQNVKGDDIFVEIEVNDKGLNNSMNKTLDINITIDYVNNKYNYNFTINNDNLTNGKFNTTFPIEKNFSPVIMTVNVSDNHGNSYTTNVTFKTNQDVDDKKDDDKSSTGSRTTGGGTRTPTGQVIAEPEPIDEPFQLTPYLPRPSDPQPQPQPEPQPPQPEPQPPQPGPQPLPPQEQNWMLWFVIIFVVLSILIVLGLLILSERKNQKKLEQNQKSLEQKLKSDEEIIDSLKSGHSIADTNAGLYAKQSVKSKGPISDSIITLEKYIISSLDAGMKPSKIKELILQSGWDHSVIEVVMHKIMLSADKLEEVEKFISKQLAKGLSDSQISEMLVRQGWSKEIVDLIISDVHKISKNTQSLSNYVKRKLSENKSLDEIHQMLVSIGWNEHYIEKILEKYQK